ncbi:CD48 antigen-like protein [Labeo rohita]|uniref:CD48 antigen-like protein n=1 Tax=Labeo rohita TaxID=84645 RepID=A0A498M6R7_LABRO|nr:CD48 antigen-like protein [Labeo rohita]
MEDLVNGEWDELKTVMEGDVLTLQTRDTESLHEATWLYKRGDQTLRIAQMYQGFEPFYEEKLTGRVKMNPKTGALTIWNISTSDSGLYEVSLHNGLISEKKVRVDVYDYPDHCSITEALIRLVLSGLVGITTVGFLAEHLRFSSYE